MLKIKDNVDLKELEKFGFEKFKRKHHNDFFAENGIEIGYKLVLSNITYKVAESRKGVFVEDIDINVPLRVIDTYPNEYDECQRAGDLDIIFDLIQAGLVEKVGE